MFNNSILLLINKNIPIPPSFDFNLRDIWFSVNWQVSVSWNWNKAIIGSDHIYTSQNWGWLFLEKNAWTFSDVCFSKDWSHAFAVNWTTLYKSTDWWQNFTTVSLSKSCYKIACSSNWQYVYLLFYSWFTTWVPTFLKSSDYWSTFTNWWNMIWWDIGLIDWSIICSNDWVNVYLWMIVTNSWNQRSNFYRFSNYWTTQDINKSIEIWLLNWWVNQRINDIKLSSDWSIIEIVWFITSSARRYFSIDSWTSFTTETPVSEIKSIAISEDWQYWYHVDATWTMEMSEDNLATYTDKLLTDCLDISCDNTWTKIIITRSSWTSIYSNY